MAKSVTTKSAPSKITATAKAAKQAVPPANDETSTFEQVYQRFQEAQDAMLKFFEAPTWKRTLAAVVSTIVVAAGVAWVGGAILDWLMIGAVASGASTFVAGIVMILGIVLTAYYGGKLAARIGGAVLTGEADEKAIAAYDAMKGLVAKFNPFKKAEVVHA